MLIYPVKCYRPTYLKHCNLTSNQIKRENNQDDLNDTFLHLVNDHFFKTTVLCGFLLSLRWLGVTVEPNSKTTVTS